MNKRMGVQIAKELIKYRKFLVCVDNFEILSIGNCFMVVTNGQIYIGEYE